MMKGWVCGKSAILRLCVCFQHAHTFSLVVHQNTNLDSVRNGFADTAKDPPKLILRKEEIFRCVWQNQLWGHSRTRASVGLITEVRQILRLGLGEAELCSGWLAGCHIWGVWEWPTMGRLISGWQPEEACGAQCGNLKEESFQCPLSEEASWLQPWGGQHWIFSGTYNLLNLPCTYPWSMEPMFYELIHEWLLSH